MIFFLIYSKIAAVFLTVPPKVYGGYAHVRFKASVARAHKISRFFTCEFSSLKKTRSKRIISISEFSTREQLQLDHCNSSMNRLLRFANRLNRFIEKNQFVHESDTASASRST